MKAIMIDGYGGPERLRLADAAMPVPGAGEVLIKVEAIGVNPADPKWRAGMFEHFAPLNFPYIPGYDVAGTVAGGAATGRLAPGTRVAAMLEPMRAGAYAQWVVAFAGIVATLPDGLSFESAAALPCPALTGLQMIEAQLDVQPGHLVLITGATGAVGRVALYAAKARGAAVVAAVRAAYRNEALALGADHVLTLGEEDWRGAKFDRAADTVGGAAVGRLCAHVKATGMIRTAATTPIPPEALPVAVGFFAVQPDAARLRAVADAVLAGRVSIPVARVLPLAQAAEAHRLLQAGAGGGKIILKP